MGKQGCFYMYVIVYMFMLPWSLISRALNLEKIIFKSILRPISKDANIDLNRTHNIQVSASIYTSLIYLNT